MIEQWFTQTEWQGIQFADLGVRLDAKSPASPEFYSAFYQSLTKKYHAYEDLPADWKHAKRETALELGKLMPFDARVLSCGAGIGYVEHVLVRDCGMTNLVLWDWAADASCYAAEGHLEYVETLDVQPNRGDQGRYDFIFLNQVLYGMSTPEAVTFLRDLRPLIKVGGELILINTSPSNAENEGQGAQEHSRRGFRDCKVARPLRAVRRWPRRVAVFGGRRAPAQGWGWARDNEAVSLILQQAGYADIAFHRAAHQSIVRANLQ